MPKKKIIKKNTNKTTGNKSQSFFAKVKFDESYVSMLLGVVVVILVALVSLAFVRVNKTQNLGKQVSSTHTVLSVPEISDSNSKSNLQEKYTVKKGDDLWNISLKIYKSGYNWIDIAKANNLENPGLIFTGMQLTIPNVKPVTVQSSVITQTQPAQQSITETSYTVVKGDNLWSIAVRAYGDGFRYPEIAKANNLTNPSLIFAGNVFRIPR